MRTWYLCFPDKDHEEHVFWTRVSERIVDLITAYTGTGVMFTVDTRLRPNGSAGALLQSEGAYKDYFAKNAEAWEGIAYIESARRGRRYGPRHKVPQ